MTTISEHRFSLRKGSRKFDCPYCGRKRCFKPYIDNETGKILHPDVGRCDHEISCPKKNYTPHEFFHDHPEAKAQYEKNGNTLYFLKHQQPVVVPEYHQTVFFPIEWVEAGAYMKCTFKEWFMGLPYPMDVIQNVLEMYYVGGTTRDVVMDGRNYGRAAIFWMIDEEQRVHDGKMIAYTPDGHRVQGWGNWIRSSCVKKKMGPQLEWTEKTFFGLHLLKRFPEKTVCLVESEKSALVCACRYPEYLWFATGGCGNLQTEKLRPLMNRRLVVYPDSGELEKWRERMQASGHRDYRMVEYLENYEPNTDIADVLLGEARAMIF